MLESFSPKLNRNIFKSNNVMRFPGETRMGYAQTLITLWLVVCDIRSKWLGGRVFQKLQIDITHMYFAYNNNLKIVFIDRT